MNSETKNRNTTLRFKAWNWNVIKTKLVTGKSFTNFARNDENCQVSVEFPFMFGYVYIFCFLNVIEICLNIRKNYFNESKIVKLQWKVYSSDILHERFREKGTSVTLTRKSTVVPLNTKIFVQYVTFLTRAKL